MIALTTPYLWYTTRATGMVALVLFTIVVSLGTLVANRIGGTIVGRFELNELHRSLSMVAIIFLVIHILTTVLDSYVPTGCHLGVRADDLGVQARGRRDRRRRVRPDPRGVGLESAQSCASPTRTWRFIHWFSWMGFTTALVHAYMTGTDSRTGIGLVARERLRRGRRAAALWRFFGARREPPGAPRSPPSPPQEPARLPRHADRPVPADPALRPMPERTVGTPFPVDPGPAPRARATERRPTTPCRASLLRRGDRSDHCRCAQHEQAFASPYRSASLLDELDASGLTGRGGAGFPTVDEGRA